MHRNARFELIGTDSVVCNASPCSPMSMLTPASVPLSQLEIHQRLDLVARSLAPVRFPGFAVGLQRIFQSVRFPAAGKKCGSRPIGRPARYPATRDSQPPAARASARRQQRRHPDYLLRRPADQSPQSVPSSAAMTNSRASCPDWQCTRLNSELFEAGSSSAAIVLSSHTPQQTVA